MFRFGKRKEPVLSATTCEAVEKLRLAIEVFIGERVRFHHVDFNTKRARVCIGEICKEIKFSLSGTGWTDCGAEIFIINEVRILARYDEPGKARAIKAEECYGSYLPYAKSWWIGRSASDRREEPFVVPRSIVHVKERPLMP